MKHSLHSTPSIYWHQGTGHAGKTCRCCHLLSKTYNTHPQSCCRIGRERVWHGTCSVIGLLMFSFWRNYYELTVTGITDSILLFIMTVIVVRLGASGFFINSIASSRTNKLNNPSMEHFQSTLLHMFCRACQPPTSLMCSCHLKSLKCNATVTRLLKFNNKMIIEPAQNVGTVCF